MKQIDLKDLHAVKQIKDHVEIRTSFWLD